MRADPQQPWLHPAVQTMIAGFNHAYQVALGTSYRVHGPIGVSYYGTADVDASFQMEFFALSADASAIVEACAAYPRLPNENYVLDIFHTNPESESTIAEYGARGYRLCRTLPILSCSVTTDLDTTESIDPGIHIERVTAERLAAINARLTMEDERIEADSLTDPHIHSFVAIWEGVVESWTQLVTINAANAYLDSLS